MRSMWSLCAVLGLMIAWSPAARGRGEPTAKPAVPARMAGDVKASLQASMRKAIAVLAAERERVLIELAATEDYREVVQEVKRLERGLAEARAGGDSAAKLEASSAFNKVVARREGMREAAYRASAKAATAREELGRLRSELRVLEREEERLAAIEKDRRNAMREPIERFEVGAVGTVDREVVFEVMQVVDGSNTLVSRRSLILWVSGFDTSAMTDGQSFVFTRPIAIKRTRQYESVAGAGKTVLEVTPAE